MTTEQTAGSSPTVSVFTVGLLSKWGFSDGDVLDGVLWDHGYGLAWKHEPDDHEGLDFDHRVLVRVVQEFVLPQIEQNVEVYTVGTIHNPIRAAAVDGVEVDATAASTLALTPDYVNVPLSEVLRIAAEEAPAGFVPQP